MVAAVGGCAGGAKPSLKSLPVLTFLHAQGLAR
jgi:hypothetical protein